MLLVSQEQDVKLISMTAYPVLVKMAAIVTMELLHIHVNVRLDLQDFHVKRTSMIAYHHLVYMGNVSMVKTLLLVLVILDMRAICVNSR